MAYGYGFKLKANIFRESLPNGYQEKKQTYGSTEVFHAWASGNVFRGRSANVFFENGTIYSYGYHFPAAKIFTNKKGEKLVLVTSEKYSTMTSKHVWSIRSAVSHLEVLTVPSVSGNHLENVEALELNAVEALETLLAGRGGDVIYKLERLEKYCDFFGLKSNLPKISNIEKDGTRALFAALNDQAAKKYAERRAAHEAMKEKKIAAFNAKHANAIGELAAAFPAALETWLAAPLASELTLNAYESGDFSDDAVNSFYKSQSLVDVALEKAMSREIDSGRRVFGRIPYGESRTVSIALTPEQEKTIRERLAKRYASEIRAWELGIINYVSSYTFSMARNVSSPGMTCDLIRVNGDRVETTAGANVPLGDAVRLYKRIMAREATKGERVGIYQFDSVSDENTQPRIVKIGCHKIDLSQAAQVLAPYLKQ